MPTLWPRARAFPANVRFPALALTLALAAATCTNHPSSQATSGPSTETGPSMTLAMSSGTATVIGGGSTRLVEGSAAIGVGYRLTVNKDSLAVLHLAAGRTFQVAPGQAFITAPATIQLISGDVLADVSAPAEIDIPGVTIQSSSGAFRVDGTGPGRVAVYRGSATVNASGSLTTVPAYRQSELVGGAASAPLGLQLVGGGDSWDQQFLASAIGLDNQLASFSNGLEAQLGTATGTSFFKAVLPNAIDVSYVAPYYPEPKSDVLIGWVIASNASPGAALPAAFATIMRLWEEGESWGVIATEYGVSGDSIFAGLQNAITDLRISLQAPTPVFPTVPGPPPTPGPRSSPAPSPIHPVTPSPVASPSPSPPGLGALLNPVTALLGQILNLLLPAPTPTPTPTP
jgi:hypothetical protein